MLPQLLAQHHLIQQNQFSRFVPQLLELLLTVQQPIRQPQLNFKKQKNKLVDLEPPSPF
jgi:hypothetical protein